MTEPLAELGPGMPFPHGPAIGLGFLLGMLARVGMLRSDYRQYPTYPHGYASHLFLGGIAALVGAVAVPALLEKEWTAVTFLVLVAQQFRGIRDMERKSLKALEDSELVPRGADYIEDMAKTFETRYYVVIFVSTVTSIGVEAVSVPGGLFLGALAFGFSALLIRKRRIGDIVEVKAASPSFRGPDLYVGDIFIMNVGLEESRRAIEEKGLGAILIPRDEDARDTLGSPGQRQAIIHDVQAILGIRKDLDTPEFSPVIRRDLETGRAGLYFMPMEKDEEPMLAVIKRVPVLESAEGRGSKALAGRYAMD